MPCEGGTQSPNVVAVLFDLVENAIELYGFRIVGELSTTPYVLLLMFLVKTQVDAFVIDIFKICKLNCALYLPTTMFNSGCTI